MEKTPFIYQRWYLRIFCSCVTIPPALAVQYWAAVLLDIKQVNFWYVLICCVVALVSLAFYYKYTQHCRWFERKGFYWAEDGIVYIQKQNEIYALKNIRWMNGTTISVYGFAKSGILVVQSEKNKIILVSSSVSPVEKFSDSELLPLLEMILAYNDALKKDDILDYWYECKE